MKSEWFKDARIYQILIDRFAGADAKANKPGFMGGNIKGITEKIDYIKNLGINTIWLSPFCKTSKYHGYHITDYKSIDPHFGTMSDLEELIDAVHKNSMRIITDFVPNHCSSKHPFFIEAGKDRKNKYFNWFCFKKWPDDYLCFLDVKDLPKLNLDNPETGEYMTDVARFWLSSGIDGYRIDHVIGPSHRFWRKFCREIKDQFPDCVLFGEAWGEGISPAFYETIHIRNKLWHRMFGISQEKLQKQYYGLMDGILDFRLNQIVVEAVKKGRGFTYDESFRRKAKKHFNSYPEDYYLVTFLDNHDMDRFLFHCNGNYELLLEALEFLVTSGNPVVIYYGTEMGHHNKIPLQINVPHSDLNVREAVDWSGLNPELYNKVKDLFDKNP